MAAALASAVLLVSAAAAWTPPPFPPTYEECFLTQPVDHFSSYNSDTFQHRYLLNTSFWGGAATKRCNEFYVE